MKILKYESRLTKKDESLYLQNKIAAESTVNKIEMLYGPFSDDEINYYRKRLIKDGRPIINAFQKQLIGYLFFKDFGDPVSLNTINQTQYIKLIIAAKRILLNSGMIILPYIISSRVSRVATRKNITKKEQTRLESSELYNKVREKYNNPKVESKVLEIIGKIISSSFEIIDWDDDNKRPGQYDMLNVPIINDIIDEEVIFFVCTI